MCGLPYSGKSTYATAMAQKNNYKFISIDEIREKKGFFWGGKEATTDEWASIFSEADNQITKSLKNGVTVIYDSTNQDRWSRDRLRQLAKDANCNSEVIFIDTPFDVILKRRMGNKKNSARSHIPDHLFDATVQSFERPNAEEGATSVVS